MFYSQNDALYYTNDLQQIVSHCQSTLPLSKYTVCHCSIRVE